MDEQFVNSVFHGDCLDVLDAHIPDQSIDLVYLDPPFNTGQSRTSGVNAFPDTWTSIHAYVAWMRERIIKLHRVLRSTGSIYLHCDHHASHYLKVMMDEVFGIENFLNDIAWCYGLGGSSNRYWPQKHDNILWYSKTPGLHYFNPPLMLASSNRMKGQYKKVVDYWDIPTINNMAKERLGYPTQKPEALLERIIAASSNPGDLVLDPFCGSGTTLAVAQRIGRQWVGIDTSRHAVDMTERRLNSLCIADMNLFGEYANG